MQAKRTNHAQPLDFAKNPKKEILNKGGQNPIKLVMMMADHSRYKKKKGQR